MREHLAGCPQCLHAACDPDLLDSATDILARRDGPAPRFEERMVKGFRDGVAQESGSEPVVNRRGFRLGIRLGLVCVLLVLLLVRSQNLSYFREDSWSGRALSAVTQVFLREPRYDTLRALPVAIGPDERRLAVAHQLTKCFVGVVMWLCFTLLCTFLLLDAWRRRHHLAPGT